MNIELYNPKLNWHIMPDNDEYINVLREQGVSKFNPIVFGFLPTETKTTSQSKSFFLPSLSNVETVAFVLFFLICSTLCCK